MSHRILVSLVALAAAPTAAAQPAPVPPAAMLDGDIAASVKRQIDRCFTLPEGIRTSGVRVKVFATLARDGTVDSVEATDIPAVRHAEAVAAAGRRAVLRCAPYRLPPERYELWREIELTFAADNDPTTVDRHN